MQFFNKEDSYLLVSGAVAQLLVHVLIYNI